MNLKSALITEIEFSTLITKYPSWLTFDIVKFLTLEDALMQIEGEYTVENARVVERTRRPTKRNQLIQNVMDNICLVK